MMTNKTVKIVTHTLSQRISSINNLEIYFKITGKLIRLHFIKLAIFKRLNMTQQFDYYELVQNFFMCLNIIGNIILVIGIVRSHRKLYPIEVTCYISCCFSQCKYYISSY